MITTATTASTAQMPTRWTRWLAADLFAGTTLPFAWSILQSPLEDALRRALTGLGAPTLPSGALWRLADDGRVYVSADALAVADQALKGAAWLGPERPAQPGGLMARWSAGGTIRRAQARVAEVQARVEPLHDRLQSWLHWVRARRWAQADLLQVMEELEPRAADVLEAYFVLSAGLRAAAAHATDLLADSLPDAPPHLGLDLYAGLTDLPSVAAAYALRDAAASPGDRSGRLEALNRYGHRGPGEMRPDAQRWADAPALLDLLAEHPVRHTAEAANRRRTEAEGWINNRLAGGRRQRLLEAVARARSLCRAADLAWDGLTMVLAAGQRWLAAAAAEACNAGLLERAEDALFLELEELKQVATGEWHRGRGEEVRALMAARKKSVPTGPAGHRDRPIPASSGIARGPVVTADGPVPPQPAAIWRVETADPGWAPFWLGAEGILVAGDDPWSPGLIVARALGVPAIAGSGGAPADVSSERTITFDGATGHVALS
ncbi:MAG: PEP-utilizing enzyme [Anaerolineae bacterium]|nr:PEP-utilizing enzyme [Anaerolineae bacterium]